MQEGKLFETHRVNINLSIDIINRVKEYASRVGIPATSAYSLLINIGLDNVNFMHNAPAYFDNLKKDIKHIVLSEPIDDDK